PFYCPAIQRGVLMGWAGLIRHRKLPVVLILLAAGLMLMATLVIARVRAETPGPLEIVVLGDSYSAGTGAGSYKGGGPLGMFPLQ
ncbi:MAG TPA: hypothetical protein VE569_10765, partial [Acidimicrobiia bacterium]|nr:hypothetical protein [Acidimicrobiia bacterium]